MKVAVVGSRSCTDYKLVESTLLDFGLENIDLIISGGARGVDTFAEKFAKKYGIKTLIFPADWNLGRQAGYIRNCDIVKACDVVIALWDGVSSGTTHSFKLAKEYNKQLKIVEF